MATLIAVLLVGGVLTAGLALSVIRPEVSGFGAAFQEVGEVVVRRFGRVPAAALVFVFGIGAVMLVMWPLGVLARNAQPLDDAVYEWTEGHLSEGLTSVMEIVTQMGNRPITKPVTLIAIVVLFLIRRERRWVIPAVFLPMFLAQFYFQGILENAIGRYDPPSAGGNYPSGGCARVVLTYGLIIFFLLRESRTGKSGFAWYGVLAAAGVLEAFSRTYLLKHWVTDTVAGLVFGLVLLLTAMAMARVFDSPGKLFVLEAEKEKSWV